MPPRSASAYRSGHLHRLHPGRGPADGTVHRPGRRGQRVLRRRLSAAAQLYTRNGSLTFDSNGQLVNADGAIIQGWMADPTTQQINTNGPDEQPRRAVGPADPSCPDLARSSSAATCPRHPPLTERHRRRRHDHQRLRRAGHGQPRHLPVHLHPRQRRRGRKLGRAGPGRQGRQHRQLAGAHLRRRPATSPRRQRPRPTPSLIGVPERRDQLRLARARRWSTTAARRRSARSARTARPPAPSSHSPSAKSGVITGVFSNGATEVLGQIALANFTNPSGLMKAGGSLYESERQLGQAQIGTADTGRPGHHLQRRPRGLQRRPGPGVQRPRGRPARASRPTPRSSPPPTRCSRHSSP